MKRKLRGFKRSAVELDYNLYRVDVPIPGLAGDELSVIDIRPEGVEQTIVLLHGFAGCAETWEHQINHFSHRYRIVAPDLRGHGQSDAPFTRYTMGEMVADLYRISQYLELPEQFVLVGHSFGGSIAVEYASAHPDQISHLVLIATAVEWPVPGIARFLFRLPMAFYRPWWRYRGRWNCEAHVFKRMALNNLQKWRGRPKMERLKVPTLVITGQRDNYFQRRVYEEVGQIIPGAEIVDIGASKHKVQLERHQAVIRAVERFVALDGGGRRAGSWRARIEDDALKERRPWLDHYSPGTPKTVPIPRRPLHAFLYSAAEWLPKRTATIFFGKKTNYSRLARSVNQLGHTLHGLGVKPGDRVMIVLPNMPQFIIAYYGTLVVGGVVVLSNPDADVDQIISQLRQTEARVLITLKGFDHLARDARQRGGVREVLLAEMDEKVADHVMPHLLHGWRVAGADADRYGQPTNGPANVPVTAGSEPVGALMAELMADAPYEAPEVPVSADDTAAILFTSGTTADPKGVCLSHRNLVANAIQTRHWMPDLEYGKELFLSVIPLLHSYGMTATMNLPIAAAGTIVLLPFFEPKELLEHVKAHRPTVFPAAPSMYAALAQVPNARSYGLESIRACISGSSPLPVEVQESFEKLTNGRLVEGYGLTEASPVTHANPLDGRGRAGSIGLPLPNTEAKIVDLASGADLPPGQIGQLLVKGPQVTNGYWQQDEEDAFLLEDGWLDTGDVAVMDADGYFHIIGRSRDLIRAGENTVYPRDVEELLYENNKVHEVAVVGVPPAAPDQKVKAFVVPRPGVKLSKDELITFCRRRLDEYAVPWEIEFREELPKSFTGKVIRRLLVE
ncbi:MAG: alpha/beta fold hydrolase [Chloroflexota bacterium]|jgi:long-chain acyl-CoA synthetase